MSSPLSAFTAIPNPQMPAFLGAQSFIMMYQAGEGWQYGKRRISALSNEEFNKLTPQSLMERQAMELKGAIPIIERSMNNMTRMIPMIIGQYGDFIREAIKAMPTLVQNVVGGQAGANLSSNMEGLNNILTAIANLLPSLPEAEARRGADSLADAIAALEPVVTIVKNNPSTIPGLTVAEAQAQASSTLTPKQIHAREGHPGHAHDAVLLPQPTVATAPSTSLVKRKAGQSQCIERKKIAWQINFQWNCIQKHPQKDIGRTAYQSSITKFQKFQQRLIDIMDRYDFTGVTCVSYNPPSGVKC